MKVEQVLIGAKLTGLRIGRCGRQYIVVRFLKLGFAYFII